MHGVDNELENHRGRSRVFLFSFWIDWRQWV